MCIRKVWVILNIKDSFLRGTYRYRVPIPVHPQVFIWLPGQFRSFLIVWEAGSMLFGSLDADWPRGQFPSQ